jgi:hypothetical protein
VVRIVAESGSMDPLYQSPVVDLMPVVQKKLHYSFPRVNFARRFGSTGADRKVKTWIYGLCYR